MIIEFKKFKEMPSLSQETLAFSARLYLDGKYVGTVSNKGDGGACYFDIPRSDMKALDDWCRALPAIPSVLEGGSDLPMNSDFYMELLASKYSDLKKIRGYLNRGKNPFIVYGRPGDWFISDCPDSPGNR